MTKLFLNQEIEIRNRLGISVSAMTIGYLKLMTLDQRPELVCGEVRIKVSRQLHGTQLVRRKLSTEPTILFANEAEIKINIVCHKDGSVEKVIQLPGDLIEEW